MKLKNILNRQKREILLCRITKPLWFLVKRNRTAPTPIFIFGVQRSGTTMLMNTMHVNLHAQLFDESRENMIFHDFRLKEMDIVKAAIRRSKADYIFLKPLADSHLVKKYIYHFPTAKIIWMYRDYFDVALSAIKKWKTADIAIRKVCRGEEGGGWFQEGISHETAKVLRETYDDSMNSYELRCLVWWSRNNLYFENKLSTHPNVILLKYEDIAGDPMSAFETVGRFIGLPISNRMYRYIHTNSIGKKNYPSINKKIKQLCDDQLQQLNRIYRRERQVLDAN